MSRSIRTTALLVLLTLTGVRSLASQADSIPAAMAGVSNRGRNPENPYVTAGDRAYLIGSQDGGFPDMGSHVAGEMGGLWVHPIKLADGFWVTVTDEASGRETALSEADELVTYPYGTLLRYRKALEGLEVERFQYSPDGQPAVIVDFRFRNTGTQPRRLDLTLAARTDLSPVWYSERIGITDAPDTVAWRTVPSLRPETPEGQLTPIDPEQLPGWWMTFVEHGGEIEEKARAAEGPVTQQVRADPGGVDRVQVGKHHETIASQP
jgi:hypothetical protein